MFIRKYQPVYAPEVEGGVDDTGTESKTPPPVADKLNDGPGSGRGSLRKALEASVKEVSDNEEVVEKKEKAPVKTGRALKSRARQELEAQEEPEVEAVDEADDSLLEGNEPEAEVTEAQAPKAWPKEAKEVWATVPPVAQAAIAKRETDIAKGVANLKQNYAEIDAVLAPRLQALKEQGHTPAQAINQLFSWMEALGQDPVRIKNGQPPSAILALAHSFGVDLGQFLNGGQQQQEQQTEEQKQAAQAEEIPPAVQKYISSLEGRLNKLGEAVQGQFQQVQQTQSMKDTTAIMEAWSQGKPYFDEIRRDMAFIIGSHMIPPKADGTADLDKAYDMALYANPTVREKVLADRRKNALEKRKKAEEAEKAAQQTAADKARRAGTGLGPSAPGVTTNVGGPAKKRQKSVRESIADAMEELGG